MWCYRAKNPRHYSFMKTYMSHYICRTLIELISLIYDQGYFPIRRTKNSTED